MSAPTLTPRDLEIAGKVWQCFKTQPQIDYEKLALVAGFKNASSASACWGPIKKKLLAQSTDSSTSANGSAPNTPGSTLGTPRKRKAPRKGGEEGTPSKKAKGGKKGEGRMEAGTGAGTESEEEVVGNVKMEGGGDKVEEEEEEVQESEQEYA